MVFGGCCAYVHRVILIPVHRRVFSLSRNAWSYEQLLTTSPGIGVSVPRSFKDGTNPDRRVTVTRLCAHVPANAIHYPSYHTFILNLPRRKLVSSTQTTTSTPWTVGYTSPTGHHKLLTQ